QDQPDVVRFPHRADRARDQFALTHLARPIGQQIPHPAAEIGAAEQHVGRQGDENDSGERVREEQHQTCGLRMIWRYSNQPTTAPSTQYSSVIAVNGTTSPGIGVTASAVFMTP